MLFKFEGKKSRNNLHKQVLFINLINNGTREDARKNMLKSQISFPYDVKFSSILLLFNSGRFVFIIVIKCVCMCVIKHIAEMEA